MTVAHGDGADVPRPQPRVVEGGAGERFGAITDDRAYQHAQGAPAFYREVEALL